jgi:preprotein translocase subunit YajC
VNNLLVQEGGSFAPASTLGGQATTQSTTPATGSPQGSEPAQPPSAMSGFWMLGLMFVVVYFFLIRPERKRQKTQQTMRDSIQKGDKVVTAGGLHGTVAALDDLTLTLKVDDNTRLKFNRNAVAHIASTKEEKPSKEGAAD